LGHQIDLPAPLAAKDPSSVEAIAFYPVTQEARAEEEVVVSSVDP